MITPMVVISITIGIILIWLSGFLIGLECGKASTSKTATSAALRLYKKRTVDKAERKS